LNKLLSITYNIDFFRLIYINQYKVITILTVYTADFHRQFKHAYFTKDNHVLIVNLLKEGKSAPTNIITAIDTATFCLAAASNQISF